MPRHPLIVLALSLTACGARTDLGEPVEDDASISEDASPDVPDSTIQDVIVNDVTVNDVTVNDVIVVDVIVPDVEVDVSPQCVPSCAFDFECQQTCPSLQTGVWCCDDQVATCYAFAGPQCPSTIVDAGFD